jgi:hypothetical protein
LFLLADWSSTFLRICLSAIFLQAVTKFHGSLLGWVSDQHGKESSAHGLVSPTEYNSHEYGFAGYTIPQIRSGTCLSAMAAGDHFEVYYSLELAPKELIRPIVK